MGGRSRSSFIGVRRGECLYVARGLAGLEGGFLPWVLFEQARADKNSVLMKLKKTHPPDHTLTYRPAYIIHLTSSHIASTMTTDKMESLIAVRARRLTMIPLQPAHIPSLYDQHLEQGNSSLFRRIYSTDCHSKEELANILSNYVQAHLQSTTWTIWSQAAQTTRGWILLQPAAHDATIAEITMFLPLSTRWETCIECAHYLNFVLFENMGYEKLEYRMACFEDGAGMFGNSIVGALSRHLRDAARSDAGSDLFCLNKAQWATTSAAVRAWLDADHGLSDAPGGMLDKILSEAGDGGDGR